MMEALNKISVFGLSAVLLFSLAVTADAKPVDEKQVLNAASTDKNASRVMSDKKQLRLKYENLKHRTNLGKMTDKRAYK